MEELSGKFRSLSLFPQYLMRAILGATTQVTDRSMKKYLNKESIL